MAAGTQAVLSHALTEDDEALVLSHGLLLGEEETDSGRVCGTLTVFPRVSGTVTAFGRLAGVVTVFPSVSGIVETEEC
jgi:hypothetical protein